MNTRITVTVCIIVLVVTNLLCAGVCVYVKSDCDDLRFLSREPSKASVIARFGMPEEIVDKKTVLEGRGWQTPKRVNQGTVWIYTRRTGMKLFIFFNGTGQIEYVFSSMS